MFSQQRVLDEIEPVEGVQELLGTLRHHNILHFATSTLPKARIATTEWLE